MPKVIINEPPVYCDDHGAFLEDCWLEGVDNQQCMWYMEDESEAN